MKVRTLLSVVLLVLAPVPPVLRAQPPVRSFTAPKERTQPDIPREYRPPRGMCRIWIDNVPPGQQPAPTDCATAIRNKPKNARVIFADDDAANDKGRDKGKESKQDKKP